MADPLTETDIHQANRILDRMFQYGEDGRDFGRYLLAAKHMTPTRYQETKQQLLELLSKKLDLLYLAEPPRQS